jgi:hypothetical protein
MDLDQLFIMLNILALTNDIIFVTNCNCSYQHVSLFNESIISFVNWIRSVEQICSMLNVLLDHQY